MAVVAAGSSVAVFRERPASIQLDPADHMEEMNETKLGTPRAILSTVVVMAAPVSRLEGASACLIARQSFFVMISPESR